MEVAIKVLPMLVNWIDGFFSVVSVSVVLFMQQRCYKQCPYAHIPQKDG